jgi:hypothetical protein
MTFDTTSVTLAQYANSPRILAIIKSFADNFDPGRRFDDFIKNVWNLDTARGWGLDLWGRIVGVNRVLQVASGKYLGFQEAGDAETFGYAPFYKGGTLTSNYALADKAYRTLIYAKASSNLTDCSIPSINAILMRLFPSYQPYVVDGGDMTMQYHFTGTLDPVSYAIVAQSGVLPRPAGVSATVIQES